MMAAPVRRDDAPEELRPFVSVIPERGLLLMWESWLGTKCCPAGPRPIGSASASILPEAAAKGGATAFAFRTNHGL